MGPCFRRDDRRRDASPSFRTVFRAPSPRSSRGEGWGERLSEVSSCIGVLCTRIACFCVEADEQFVGESDSDDHFFFSSGEQSVAELCKGLVVFGGDSGDQEQDRTDAGAAAADGPLALALTAVIGERGETYKLGNGLVGGGSDLRQVGHQAGDGAAGGALTRAAGFCEACPQ